MGESGPLKAKNVKGGMKLNCNFQRGGGRVLKKKHQCQHLPALFSNIIFQCTTGSPLVAL